MFLVFYRHFDTLIHIGNGNIRILKVICQINIRNFLGPRTKVLKLIFEWLGIEFCVGVFV